MERQEALHRLADGAILAQNTPSAEEFAEPYRALILDMIEAIANEPEVDPEEIMRRFRPELMKLIRIAVDVYGVGAPPA